MDFVLEDLGFYIMLGVLAIGFIASCVGIVYNTVTMRPKRKPPPPRSGYYREIDAVVRKACRKTEQENWNGLS